MNVKITRTIFWGGPNHLSRMFKNWPSRLPIVGEDIFFDIDGDTEVSAPIKKITWLIDSHGVYAHIELEPYDGNPWAKTNEEQKKLALDELKIWKSAGFSQEVEE